MGFRDLKHSTEKYRQHAVGIDEYPNPRTYKYVLARYDLTPTPGNYFRFQSYNEQCKSRPFIINNRIAQTIFLKDSVSARLAVRQGWTDVTEHWKKKLADEIPRPTSYGQQEIYKYLEENPGWHSKSDILENTKVPDSQWRTAIKSLQEKDLVSNKGFGRAVKYTSKPMKQLLV